TIYLSDSQVFEVPPGGRSKRNPPTVFIQVSTMSPIAPSDYVALHRAILDDPDSDAPRLALAVWDERNGKAVRGQLLRQEVKDRELVRAPLPEALDGRAVYRR